MKREVITHNIVQGFHKYPSAPKDVEYLSSKHRHIFVIECHAEVSHNEREIEIIGLQDEIEKLLVSSFGNPCDFKDMSCESIAQYIMEKMPVCNYVKVLEDGFGGAALTR